MKDKRIQIGWFLALMLLAASGCHKDWDAHYTVALETVNENVWDALQKDPEVSLFMGFLKEFHYDTLFLTDNAYTLFIPVNQALQAHLDTGEITTSFLNYHISSQFIQPNAVKGKLKIQTLEEKFALLEYGSQAVMFDGIEITFESPLFLNGKYFRMKNVAIPKHNIYEYIAQNNPILKKYIDDLDSVALNKELSRPIGFDEHGNTIYDSVSVVINRFEEKYFPVKHEFRNKTATLVFPKLDNYNQALDVMAEALGVPYHGHADIPYEWQKEVLIPQLLNQGIFENMLEETDFMKKNEKDTVKLKNILGDSIHIFYSPVEKSICSNGYAYDYAQFTIPDTLYMTSSVFEGEWLLRPTGINKNSWKDSVVVVSDQSFQPVKEFLATASNDSILKVNFPKKYAGRYKLQFKTKSLFPRKYLMVIKTHMDIGGIYDIYVNGRLVRTFDYYDYVRNRGIYFSVTGSKVLPVGRFNIIDCWVDNITSYQKAEIRLEYKGPGNAPNNGLVIDCIEFRPESDL
ncbi:MAG: hypothetical protein WBK43_10375 [Prolixibacteraceae bacterium]|jgi:hypothetical protein|nr:hypothetical protein [Prolixibacteraceae bacterium]MDI9562847.1 hypothetical protein [Bacteroidota bacterium]NLS99792.1 hypothetical protein [Bacteroidales bacterium]OQB80768.1 MAG: hypothetical protein BWX87_01202 [Bacteroidetes bacterium ADurb.Bin123]HNU76950.1 hypothetical protein [Prolixibacteraceae bacterium]